MRQPIPPRDTEAPRGVSGDGGNATVLAVALGNQRMGLAVATREHLLSFATLDLWKGGAEAGRLELFRRSVARRLQTFMVTEIVSVAPATRETVLTKAATEILDAFAAENGLPRRHYTRAELKRSQVVGARSFHLMALRLAHRYPELASRVRARAELPGYRGIPTPHDDYNRWMFLAVAAADQALADAITGEHRPGSHRPRPHT